MVRFPSPSSRMPFGSLGSYSIFVKYKHLICIITGKKYMKKNPMIAPLISIIISIFMSTIPNPVHRATNATAYII